MKRTFTIRDIVGRTWGSFEVVSEKYGKLFGYLKPTPQFEDIRGIFEEHGQALRRPDGDPSFTAAKIAALGAFATDDQTGKAYDLRGEIFVDSQLLVACELHEQR